MFTSNGALSTRPNAISPSGANAATFPVDGDDRVFCQAEHRRGGVDCFRREGLCGFSDEVIESLPTSVRDKPVDRGNPLFHTCNDGIS